MPSRMANADECLFESQTISRLLPKGAGAPSQHSLGSYDSHTGKTSRAPPSGFGQPPAQQQQQQHRPLTPASMSSTMWYSSHGGAMPTNPSEKAYGQTTLGRGSPDFGEGGVRQYDRHPPIDASTVQSSDMSQSLLHDASHQVLFFPFPTCV